MPLSRRRGPVYGRAHRTASRCSDGRPDGAGSSSPPVTSAKASCWPPSPVSWSWTFWRGGGPVFPSRRSTPAGSWSVPPDVPRAFDRRADGFRHAAAGGLWLAPLVYLEHARFGPGWYGKVVSADPDRLLTWAISKAIPQRALQFKSLPDLDSPFPPGRLGDPDAIGNRQLAYDGRGAADRGAPNQRRACVRLHAVQLWRPRHAAGGDQIGEPHRQPDQHCALAYRRHDVVQLIAKLLEEFVGDRLGPLEKGVVARVANVVGVPGRHQGGFGHG